MRAKSHTAIKAVLGERRNIGNHARFPRQHLIYFKGNATVKISLLKASIHKMGIDTPYSTQISYHKIRKKSSKGFRFADSDQFVSVILTNCHFSKNQHFYIIFSSFIGNVILIYLSVDYKPCFCPILLLIAPFLSVFTHAQKFE